MTHEIRTPMNAIIGMTELVLETELSEEQREHLESASSSAEMLLGLLNDILDFSKIEAGKLDTERINFDLTGVVEAAVDTFALRAHQKGLEISCDLEADVPTHLIGDPTRTRQILVNLLSNGLKFTDVGEISVHVSCQAISDDGCTLQFDVRDTGVGIPADRQGSIFDAFTQADGSVTRQYGGTGLGLAISTRLVQLMGGRIWLDSAVGEGSTFHFTLEFGHTSTTQAPVDDPFGDVRALVVDDNATNRLIVEKILTRWGITVTTADGGGAALDAMHQSTEAGQPFHVILLDVMMPNVDGFTVASKVMSDPKLSSTAVMMLSSTDRTQAHERCRELGIELYLSKPVKQRQLRGILLRALGAKESSRSEASPASLSTGRSLHVLLAEDNPLNQKVALARLKKWGYSVDVVEDGRRAVEAVAAGSYDLVLMDVQMPEMDGIEATEAIRAAESRDQRLPIIALTAHAMKGDRERFLVAGMDSYVSKPIRPDELQAAIVALVPSLVDTDGDPRETSPLFDPDRVQEASEGDPELLRDLIDLFLEDLPRQRTALKAAVERSDVETVKGLAHDLRGSVMVFGDGAAAPLARLEQLSIEGQLDGATRYMADVEASLAELVDRLKTERPA